jgi:hypothetical protein
VTFAAGRPEMVVLDIDGTCGRELSDVLSNSAIPHVRCCCYTDEALADLTAAGVTKAAMLERLRVQLGPKGVVIASPR